MYTYLTCVSVPHWVVSALPYLTLYSEPLKCNWDKIYVIEWTKLSFCRRRLDYLLSKSSCCHLLSGSDPSVFHLDLCLSPLSASLMGPWTSDFIWTLAVVLLPAWACLLLLIFWFSLLCLVLSSKPMISCHLDLLELQETSLLPPSPSSHLKITPLSSSSILYFYR